MDDLYKYINDEKLSNKDANKFLKDANRGEKLSKDERLKEMIFFAARYNLGKIRPGSN